MRRWPQSEHAEHDEDLHQDDLARNRQWHQNRETELLLMGNVGMLAVTSVSFHFSSLDGRTQGCVRFQSALRKYPRGGDPTYSAPGAAKMRQAAGRSLVHSILMPRHSHSEAMSLAEVVCPSVTV
jgi:hypothetical protein